MALAHTVAEMITTSFRKWCRAGRKGVFCKALEREHEGILDYPERIHTVMLGLLDIKIRKEIESAPKKKRGRIAETIVELFMSEIVDLYQRTQTDVPFDQFLDLLRQQFPTQQELEVHLEQNAPKQPT
ncbi:hypothetical protein HOI18_01905 [Candidatus Uhrbacteria bacterium]|jgi:hypothetical protein|nr:hypothetical protein [Candidatus Uhrbacteria bacterium]